MERRCVAFCIQNESSDRLTLEVSFAPKETQANLILLTGFRADSLFCRRRVVSRFSPRHPCHCHPPPQRPKKAVRRPQSYLPTRANKVLRGFYVNIARRAERLKVGERSLQMANTKEERRKRRGHTLAKLGSFAFTLSSRPGAGNGTARQYLQRLQGERFAREKTSSKHFVH